MLPNVITDRVNKNVLTTRVGRSGRRIFVIEVGEAVSAKRYRVTIDPNRVSTVRVSAPVVIGVPAGIHRSGRVSPASPHRVSVNWIPFGRIPLGVHVYGVSADGVAVVGGVSAANVVGRIFVVRVSSTVKRVAISSCNWVPPSAWRVSVGEPVYGIPFRHNARGVSVVWISVAPWVSVEVRVVREPVRSVREAVVVVPIVVGVPIDAGRVAIAIAVAVTVTVAVSVSVAAATFTS